MSFKSASNNVEIKTSDEMNNSLNELFNVVYDKSPCRQKPLNERQLPRSFFVQPSGSSTSSRSSHYKAFSSPATLEETYRAGPGNQINNLHFKQHSLDSQNGNQHFSELSHISNIEIKSHSPAKISTPRLDIEIKKLPHGYEMAINENGQVYFLNHATKVTTWFDPRLPETIQKWGMTLNELQQLHIHYINILSDRHSSTQKQPSVALLRSQQLQLSQSDQSSNFPDSKSQTHFRSCSQPVSSSGASLSILDTSSTTLNNFQVHANQPVAHLQYFVSNNNGGGPIVNSYHELCHLNPHCSSIQGSRSHSNNSSCSNLSTCLNGLNLSPAPLTPTHHSGNSMMIAQSHYGGHISPGQNTTGHSHSHQDSMDSGVGQSVASQSHLSNNVSIQNNDQNKSFDMPLKLEETDNLDSCFNDKFDEYMDVDIRSLNY